MTTLDLDFARQRFPALGGDWTFLDNAGGSQTLGAVADRVRDYLLTTDVQLGATYQVSRDAEGRVNDGVRAMATLLNAADPSEIVIGSSTSALLRMLAITLGGKFSPGDEIVVTNCDHEANIGPWMDLQAQGIRVRTWSVNPETLRLEGDDLAPLLRDRTRLVAVTHASNVLGHVNPIADWARLVHDHGALICVDGVAYAPHRRIDVLAWDVDFYAVSLYKVYGPHLGVLFGKREHLLALPRWNHFFIGDDQLPYKLQPGNVNYELTWGAGAIVDYLLELGDGNLVRAYDRMTGQENALGEQLLAWLRTRPNVRVIGPSQMTDDRVPTISFVVDGVKSSAIPPRTDAARIGIRWGDFYARRLIDDLGLASTDGVVRISVVHYNTEDEIARLIEVLDPWI